MEGKKQKIKKVVKLSDYSIDTLLGSGSFGKVKLARRKKDSSIFCVKIMKKSEIIESKQTDHIINECEIISQINHPMIVRLVLFRLASKESAKIQSTFKSSWNMLEEDNSSLISEKKEILILLKLGIRSVIQILCLSNHFSFRILAST